MPASGPEIGLWMAKKGSIGSSFAPDSMLAYILPMPATSAVVNRV